MKVIRLLVRAKPGFLLVTKKASDPFRRVWRFLMGPIIVRVYHLIYMARKSLSRVYRPARNKLMLLITNRVTIHVIITAIVVVVAVLNIQTSEVRAEDFGEKSLLYSIVSQQNIYYIEESAEDVRAVEMSAVNYREPTALTSFTRGVDFVYSDDVTVSFMSGGTIFAPTMSESLESTAPRDGSVEYTVESGDTLSTIAEQFGISVNTVLWANDLTVRSVLKPGDTLTILPVSGVIHKVASGDTLTEIADEYDVEESTIIEYNKLASASDIVIGEELMVPGGTVQAPAPTSGSAAVTQVFSQPSTTTSITTTTSSEEPTTTGSGVMIWPTDLHVITQYYGWSHTGVDFDCYYDNDNYAADDGIVQYAGWKGGYGYTVEINHGNGIVTRYGHHASIYVTAGQQVTKGQAIGRCGTTGRSTGTHLHFEVIVNGRFTNPLEWVR